MPQSGIVWIPKGLVALKTEISNCTVCRKYNALACKYPKVVDMHKHYMNLVKPFNHVRIDFTGHFRVKDELSGGTVKMFVLILTCLNVRAVHFELLAHMSTRNFVLAFQRFCNNIFIVTMLKLLLKEVTFWKLLCNPRNSKMRWRNVKLNTLESLYIQLG